MEKQLKVISSTKAPMNKNTVWLDPKQDSMKFFDNGKWQKIIGGASNSEEVQVIEWSHTHNMNDYKTTGTYRIKGERTGSPMDDNLPIMNQGSGHTIDGVLYVLDSSLTNGSGNSDDCTITQFLMLSNRVGGQEGDMYMRSAYGANKDSLTWKPWEKYQTNIEVGCVSDDATHEPKAPFNPISENGLNSFVDNGIYSGVYLTQEVLGGDTTKTETFVMVVINNYAADGDNKTITQIKFAVTNAGEYSMERRSRGFDGKWSGWINEYNDLSTQIVLLQKEVATKQQELTLTVLDNGNIRIGNLQGQTKDFMPATPSGDPMHYIYEEMGAVYNSGADVIAQTPWASLVDDADYNAKWGLNLIPDNATFVKTLKYNGVDREVWQMKHPNKNMQIWVVADYASDGTKIWDDTLVVKRSGMWYFLGLGDLMNSDMRTIRVESSPTVANGTFFSAKSRGIMFNRAIDISFIATFQLTQAEVVDSRGFRPTSNSLYMFSGSRITHILNVMELSAFNSFAENTLALPDTIKTFNFTGIGGNITLSNPNITMKSILYAINKAGTKNITISLVPSLYERVIGNEEITNALNNKPNITLAST